MLSKKMDTKTKKIKFFAESPKIALGKEISLPRVYFLPRVGEDLSAKRSLPRA
jgi:hypothetical protein